jgi:hypothetical protein
MLEKEAQEASKCTGKRTLGLTVLASGLIFATIPKSRAVAQSTGDLTKTMQGRWMRCLKASYQVRKKETRDQNAAAEMALQACTTEGDELWTYSAQAGVPRSAFVHLRAATKQVLIEGK